ncbi:hypothetical protein [Halorubrum sp. F4]|uniref:hypothetical protein n=1 Tax=Halorubrum sp. F4 TaxID=2989715 RepID=UPI00247FFFC8|nr:hypothetical protein [Halorubrum sp. F4]
MAEDGHRTAASGRSAENGRKRVLRIVAVQAAAVSAAVHLLWAWPRLAEPNDPRPYLFVLAAAFTVVVAAATLRADEYRRLYALGAGTLTAYPVGYVAWHGGATVAALAADPLAIVGKTAEVVGTVAFLALYRLAPPTSVVVARRTGDEVEGDGPEGGEPDDE